MNGYETGSTAGLATIATALMAASLVGAIVSRRRAPAVTLGLVGGLLAAAVGFWVAASDGPHGVPQEVGTWASLGLAIQCLVEIDRQADILFPQRFIFMRAPLSIYCLV